MAGCTHCGSYSINDYGGCTDCGQAFEDIESLTLTESLALAGSSSSSSEPAITLKASTNDFAEYTNSQFTSSTFQLLIGPEKKEFNLHKSVLQSKCPYFTTLFGTRIPTREIAENSVTLDSAVDTVDAWKMCIQFLYLNSYNMVDEEKWTQCVVNAGVYVLAQKLCMEALKEMALEKFADLLQGMYQGSFAPSGKEVARLVEVVYGGTEDHEGGEDVAESAATPVECAEEPRGGDEGGDEGIVGEQERNQETQHSKVNFPPDPMRTLVATYAASRVMTFRRDKSFMDVVRFWGDFAADLVLGVDDGPILDSGTLNNIKARTRNTWGNSRRTNFFGG